MNKFLISVEAACDLDQETIEKNNIKIAPMHFLINGEEICTSSKDFSSEKIAKLMREGATTKTTQINEFEAKEYLRELLKEDTDILHISFSSAMSATYSNFAKSAEELKISSGKNIIIIDSLCQSGGLGLLVKMLLNEISLGTVQNIYQAKEYLDNNKLNVCHIFTVDNLKYLARGGRISGSTAFIGNLLQLKPVLHLNDKGIIVSYKKVLGRKKSIHELFEVMKNTFNHKFHEAIITEADCKDEANYLKSLIEKELNTKTTVLTLSPLVTTHSGPGTLALYYTADKR